MNNLESTLSNILQTSRECLVVLDSALKVVKANPNFYHLFKETEENVIGYAFADIQDGQWKNEQLLSLLSGTLKDGRRFDNYELNLSLPNEHCEKVSVKARPLQVSGIDKEFVLLVINCIESTKTNMQTIHQ